LLPLAPILDASVEVIVLGDYPGDTAGPTEIAVLGAAIDLPVCRYLPAFQRTGAASVSLVEHAARTAELLVDALGTDAPAEIDPLELAKQFVQHSVTQGLGQIIHYGFVEFRKSGEGEWSCPSTFDNTALLDQLTTYVFDPLSVLVKETL
jgi:hypothetical protein